MSDFETLPQAEYGTELVGPFLIRSDPYELSVDGFKIDLVKVFKMDDGTWEVNLDERITFPGFTEEEIKKFGSLLAHAIVMGHNAKYGRWSISLDSLFSRLIGLRTPPDDVRKSFQIISGDKE